MKKLRIVVGGFIGLFPTGGAVLDYIQFPLGLKRLGHEVYYIEDTGCYPIYQKENSKWNDATDCVEHLKTSMEHFGLGEAWAYRDIASGRCYGMTLEKVLDICRTADVFLNISCSTIMRDEYFRIPQRILLDSDPMFTQIQYHNELAEGSVHTTKEMIENHNYLFSFGENIGLAGCTIPTFGFRWRPIRQPVCLDLWENKNPYPKYHFTSIMNWSIRKKLLYDNQEWGQKDVEFMKYMQLPLRTGGNRFQMVINPPLNADSTYNREQIRAAHWEVFHPHDVIAGFGDYIEFIKNSFAEFSVAKETYVKANSGWFSCRSACYLASSRPVLAQDTGWTSFIPAGEGILSFKNMEEAIDAVKEVTGNYSKHARAAKEIASCYFDSNIVLGELIKQLN